MSCRGFKRHLFKSIWNVVASVDLDYSDFLQLCALVLLRSSRNVSVDFGSSPDFFHPHRADEISDWFLGQLLLYFYRLMNYLGFLPKACLCCLSVSTTQTSRGRFHMCTQPREQDPGFLSICSFVGSKRETVMTSVTVFLWSCRTSWWRHYAYSCKV